MSLETEALDAVSLAATNQTIAANALKNAIDILTTEYASTKANVDNNLNQVDNTTDANKPISLDTIAEFLKYVEIDNLATVNGQPLNTGLELLIASSPTSLTSKLYDDRAELRNPITPQPTAGDALILEFLGLFQFYESTEEPDDDETCFTANDQVSGLPYGQWLLRVPAYEWTEAHESMQKTEVVEWREDIEATLKDIQTRLLNNNI